MCHSNISEVRRKVEFFLSRFVYKSMRMLISAELDVEYYTVSDEMIFSVGH